MKDGFGGEIKRTGAERDENNGTTLVVSLCPGVWSSSERREPVSLWEGSTMLLACGRWGASAQPRRSTGCSPLPRACSALALLLPTPPHRAAHLPLLDWEPMQRGDRGPSSPNAVSCSSCGRGDNRAAVLRGGQQKHGKKKKKKKKSALQHLPALPPYCWPRWHLHPALRHGTAQHGTAQHGTAASTAWGGRSRGQDRPRVSRGVCWEEDANPVHSHGVWLGGCSRRPHLRARRGSGPRGIFFSSLPSPPHTVLRMSWRGDGTGMCVEARTEVHRKQARACLGLSPPLSARPGARAGVGSAQRAGTKSG